MAKVFSFLFFSSSSSSSLPFATPNQNSNLPLPQFSVNGDKKSGSNPSFFGESSYHSYDEEMDFTSAVEPRSIRGGIVDDHDEEPPYHVCFCY